MTLQAYHEYPLSTLGTRDVRYVCLIAYGIIHLGHRRLRLSHSPPRYASCVMSLLVNSLDQIGYMATF